MLNFTKSVILGPQWLSYGSVYLCTKFNTNVFIGNQDVAKNPNP